MKIIYIHAGKRISNRIKKCEYHIQLFQSELNMSPRYVCYLFQIVTNIVFKLFTPREIEKLPRGQIVGLALFSDAYWYDQSMHQNDNWCYGPYCYKILDVIQLETNIFCRGFLGLWKPSKEIHEKIINQNYIKNKISYWLGAYGDQLSFFKFI